mmetsp:Transcript_20869/g.32713  ORF Transcript_20869/g.32713 Transcript_20869/m.32713 type:complete len:162 (-) Transcript_20869:275-760(-)
MGNALHKKKPAEDDAQQRLPRYADVEDDRLRVPVHVPLGEDPVGKGVFMKMTDRPLMSLVQDDQKGHKGGAGLPMGMRTDGIYYLPDPAQGVPNSAVHHHVMPASQVGSEAGGDGMWAEPAREGKSESGKSEEDRKVPVITSVSGRQDRVFFLVSQPQQSS